MIETRRHRQYLIHKRSMVCLLVILKNMKYACFHLHKKLCSKQHWPLGESVVEPSDEEVLLVLWTVSSSIQRSSVWRWWTINACNYRWQSGCGSGWKSAWGWKNIRKLVCTVFGRTWDCLHSTRWSWKWSSRGQGCDGCNVGDISLVYTWAAWIWGAIMGTSAALQY